MTDQFVDTPVNITRESPVDDVNGLPHDTHQRPKKKKGLAFAFVAVAISVLSLLFLAAVMVATHAGIFDLDFGFKTLTLGLGPMLAKVTLAAAALSLLISLFLAPRRYGPWALLAVVLSGTLLGAYQWYRWALKTNPPIAEAATNWDRPVGPSDLLLKARGPDAKPVEDLPRVPSNESMQWGGKTVASINALTCADAKTVQRQDITSDQVAALFKSDRHYRIVDSAPAQVEATYRDDFYGFPSDVIVRLDTGGIDVRSVGRYNIPDLGANCRRVTDLVEKIRTLPVSQQAAIDAASADTSSFDVSADDGGGDGGGD